MAREISQQILDESFSETTEFFQQNEFLSSSSLSSTSLPFGIKSNNHHEPQLQQLQPTIIPITHIKTYFFESLDLGVSIKKMVSQFPNFLQQIFIPPSDLVQYLENTIKKTATDDGGGVSETTGNKSLLGFCYEYGIGTTPKLNSAFNLYKEVALHNDKYAQNFVSRCYRTATGTEKNEHKAFLWAKKSAESGFPLGEYNLGFCYYNQIGTKKDDKAAFQWYRKSAYAPRNMAGKFAVGLCLGRGIGTQRNEAESRIWYRIAAEGGEASGANSLARCYSKGYGGKVDLYKAAYWYRKSAQLENSDGQFTLGAMCWSGRGVSRDLHEGFKYLRRAYKNGNETTIRFLLWRGLHFSKFTFIENFN